MKLELIFEGDTILEYLDKLHQAVNDEQRREKVLHDSAEDVVELIDEVVPKWNPNLRYSGLNEDFWDYTHSKDNSDITILYTGFTGEGRGEPDDIAVWWEFGKYHKGGYGDILGRDYAYYQEVGKDKFATGKEAKYKAADFEGHHYVESGMLDSWDMIEWRVGEYLERIIHLK